MVSSVINQHPLFLKGLSDMKSGKLPDKPLLVLINPYQAIKQYASNIGFARFLGKKTGMVPLALPYLAALTPDDFDIRIIDEEIEPVPANLHADIVAITAMSTNIDRAYALADRFRARNITVILGGPFASACSAEASLHADSVMIGEADSTWADMLNDWRLGKLHATYQADAFIDMKTIKHPRWDLVDTKQMAAIPVQVSRGCPHRCEFCLVTELFGQKMRYREIDDVIAEIEALPLKTIFFVDDNLTANKKYARELMARLKPLGIQWFCMASIEISRFPDLLEDMADCGCMHILVGFESLNPASLAETQKAQNRAQDYIAAIESIHKAGINVNASFIVGFDNDTLDEYDRLHNFLQQSLLWYPNINILDVIPGSRLYDRIVKEGRWSDRPNYFSGGLFPVMRYMNVSQIDLFKRNLEFMDTIFSWKDIRKRIVPLFSTGWFAKNYPNHDVSVFRKTTMTFSLLRLFLFSPDPDKRGLFKDLAKLIYKKVVAVEKVVFFLVTMEGIQRLSRDLAPHIPIWSSEIKAFDQGPWRPDACAADSAVPAVPE